MKLLKSINPFNEDDVVTLKEDKATIEKLKKWNEYDSEMLDLLYGEESVIQQDDVLDGENYVELSNGYTYPIWSLKLVKNKEKNYAIQKVEINTSDDKRIITFRNDKKVATFECGETIQIDDIIALGEIAKKFKLNATTPARKKTAKKK